MDSTVVNKIHFLDVGTIGGKQFAHRPAQKVVADVTQMEWFVGVGRGILDHHGFGIWGGVTKAETGVVNVVGYKTAPIAVGHREVEKPFYSLEGADFLHRLDNSGTQFSRHSVGGLASHLDVRKYDDSIVALKIFAGVLQHYRIGRYLGPIEMFHCIGNGLLNLVVNHIIKKILICFELIFANAKVRFFFVS
jgi:hypothetical protein